MKEMAWWKSKGIDISLSEDNNILYEGPSYALTPQVLELLRCQKDELLEELLVDQAAQEDRRSFAQWMECMWVEASRPHWWHNLNDALRDGDLDRARYSWRMLTEVLETEED